MQPRELVLLEGRVENIKYRNEENGYTVFMADCGDDYIAVVGSAHYLGEGETFKALGEWTTHASFGRQFKAQSIEHELPEDAEGILMYLSSGTLKGVGPSTAQRLVEEFGDETLEVIAREPQRLKGIRGLSAKKASELTDQLNERLDLLQLFRRLRAFDIPAFLGVRIFMRYGRAAADRVEENPYFLCDEAFGMDFEQADKIARLVDIPADSPLRLQAGVKYVLRHNLQNGHTFLPRASLSEAASRLLGCPGEVSEESVEQLCEVGELVAAPVGRVDAVYLSRYRQAESVIASRLRLLSASSEDLTGEVEDRISRLEKENGMVYAGLQREAIRQAAKESVMLLTGGPGTGKTTTLLAIIRIYEELGLTVALTAPTGRAAKRMSEVTGREAKTIHRLLEMDFRDGQNPVFKRDEQNPLPADAVIVDETSMVDVLLMESLLRALRPGCRLLLVGDSDQLPPVGPGNVLKDLLAGADIPRITLTEIFRQARNSLIVVNAHSINRGEYPQLKVKDGDFFFIRRDSEADAASTICELCATRLPAAYGYDPIADIQVISPLKKGAAGTISLNRLLQETLNPPKAELRQKQYFDTLYREGDKVMQIRNNYDLSWYKYDSLESGAGVFNGDVGLIEQLDLRAERCRVKYDDRFSDYPFLNLEELELAYAMTVHKSQGSEFPVVVMPAFMNAPRLQSRNLLYTAVTRAKSMVILVGQERAVNAMVDNDRQIRRFSGLKYVLMEEGQA